jgi:hypothetical protein
MWWTAVAFAGGAELSPDRPGYSDSVDAVAPGHVGLEGGLLWEAGGDMTAPLLNLRIGVARGFELRVATPGVAIGRGGLGAAGEFGLGAKVAFDLADVVEVSVVETVLASVQPNLAPTGGVGLFSGVNAEWDLSERWGMAANLIVITPLRGDGAWSASGALAASVAASDVLGGYVQVIGLGSALGPSGAVGVGVTLRVAPRLQLDVYVDGHLIGAELPTVVGTGVATVF